MRRHILSIIILCFLIAAMTFPLVFKINSCIPGFSSTDEPYGAVWYNWWLRYTHQNNMSSLLCTYIAAPFGINFGAASISYPAWQLLPKFFSIVTNEIIAYNIFVLMSFVLTAIIMYFMVYYLTKDRLASLVSSAIYTFCPYHFVRSWQHLAIAQIQWMPLFIFSLLYLREKKNYRAVIFVAISYFLISCFELGYAYFMAIATIVFIICTILYDKRKSLQTIWLLTIGIFSAFILLLPQVFPIIKSILVGATATDVTSSFYRRPFEDLFLQSARPLSYFLPSVDHPILGNITKSFLGSALYGVSFTEHTLYLGWVALILAFIAIRIWKGNKKVRNSIYKIKISENFAIGFFVSLAIVAWLFSQPPWWNIGPIKIFMPSFFMYKILPMFRAYCRFGIVVMLSVSVLAGFGLHLILGKFKAKRSRILITVFIIAVVLFEFLNFPPFKVIDLKKYPKVYDWLREETQDIIIAEYPLDVKGPSAGPGELYKFYQTIHHKRIINGTGEGSSPYKLLQGIIFLSEPENARVLKWLGVKYTLVHKDLYDQTGLVDVLDDFDNIKNNRGLKFVKRFDDVYVYEVIAKPKKPDFKE